MGRGGIGGGGAQLGILAEWELIDHRRELRGNYEALCAGMICAEVTTHLIQAHDPHPDIFAELEAALELLGKQPGQAGAGAGQSGRTLAAYIKAALVGAGFWPRLCGVFMGGRCGWRKAMWFSSCGCVFCHEEPRPAVCRTGAIGSMIAAEGKILVALERLALPRGLLANAPERPADERSLAAALQLLFRHLECMIDGPHGKSG